MVDLTLEIGVVTCFLKTFRTSGGKTIPYHSFFGDIELKNVSFTYPTRPDQVVVENLSLSIKGGQMVSCTHHYKKPSKLAKLRQQAHHILSSN
jgi:ABC-type multidrug transport system fused ATPase/permease subunit